MGGIARAARAAGVVVTFAGATVAALVLHVDTPAARRLLVAELDDALATTFKGRLVVDEVGHVGLDGVAGARVRVLAPDGSCVLDARGVSAHVRVLDVARSALFGHGPIAVRVDRFTIDAVDVDVDADTADGSVPKIASAFDSRGPAKPSSPDARGVDVDLAAIDLRHLWAHGRLGGAAIDADLDDVRGGVRVAGGVTTIDVAHLTLTTRGLPRGLDARGDLRARLAVPSPAGGAIGVDAAFDGTVGGAPATARARLDGGDLEATLDVPRAGAVLLRAAIPDAPDDARASLHVEARGAPAPGKPGDLGRVDVTAHADVAGGTVRATAALNLGAAAPPHAGVTVDADGIDLHALSKSAPASTLAATARASIDLGAAPAGTFDVEVRPGVVGPNDVPHARITGRLDASGALSGVARVDERGAPTDVTFALAPDADTLDVGVRSHVADVARVPRLRAREAHGAVDVTARATMHLRARTVTATVDADAHDVAAGSARASTAHLHATVRGPLAAPVIDATLAASDVASGDTTYDRVVVTARGKPGALAVEASLAGREPAAAATTGTGTGTAANAEPGATEGGPVEITARAVVDLTHGAPIIGAVDARVRRGRAEVEVRARQVRVAGGDVRVEDVVVEGLGRPGQASVRLSPGRAELHLHLHDVPVDRVAQLLGARDFSGRGRADVDADLIADGRGATGRARARLSEGSFGGLAAVRADADATFEGRSCDARASADLGDLGRVTLATRDLTFAHGPLAALGAPGRAAREVTGAVEVEGDVDLARLASLLPPGTLPVARVAGRFVTRVAASRADAQADPDVEVSAKTTGLAVTARDGTAISGVDLAVDAHAVAGGTGASSIVARAVDASGAPIVAVDARADAVPWSELVAAPSSTETVARLEAVPITLHVDVPTRALTALPGAVAPDAKGEIGATLDVEGTARDPRAHLVARARGVRAADGEGNEALVRRPLDLDLDVAYDGAAAEARAALRSRGAPLVDARARLDVKAAEVLARGADAPWSASASAHLAAVPLGALAPLSDRAVKGSLSGEAVVEGIHTATPRARVDLTAAALKVGTADVGTAKLQGSLSDGHLAASARVDQPTGFAALKTELGARWDERTPVPALDAQRPIAATFEARAFRLAALQPLVDATLNELDGTLDGVANVVVDPRAAAGKRTTIDGALSLRDGVFQLASTGTELHGARAQVTVTRDGVARVDDAVAYGVTGVVKASAAARFDGDGLVGFNAVVRVPKGQAVPVDVGGTQLGNVFGDVSVRALAAADRRTMNVAVDVKDLDVTLPLSLTHAPRELDELPNVHVGMYAVAGTFAPLAIDGRKAAAPAPVGQCPRWDVAVNLEDVEISRGSSLKVSLAGAPRVVVACTTTVAGQIRLRRGALDVQGKKFDIENGTITFGSDPSNPYVVVTAGWTAPDGTRVYADFVGPLKTGKVTLRSEPARSKNEILALIVFGSADATQNGAASVAEGAAGGLATEGLTRGIDDLTGLEVATRVDTTNAQSPRPEVEVQIARSISLQIAFVLGTPPPGTNPDRTFATIDWRFLRRWSLATTFGDQGSSLADVVWRYRY